MIFGYQRRADRDSILCPFGFLYYQRGLAIIFYFLGLVLGAFFYGYWILQIPGAWLAIKIGGTRVFGYGVLLTSLLAILTPIAARYHVMALVGVRIFQGLFLVS